MFLTVHSAVGVIIGQNISNPIATFFLGLLSHYIFDIIPHGDTKAPQKYKNPIHIGLAAILDFSLLTSWLILIVFHVQITLAVLTAIFGAILPDLLQAVYFISGKKFCVKCQELHNFIHDAISKHLEFRFITGIILQIIIFIILNIIIL